MSERYPDIEIYIMKADENAVRAWLLSVFESLEVLDKGQWRASYQGKVLELHFDPKAEKNFASLWFKENHTPWPTDLDCARAAHAALGAEIRCQGSAWQEEEGETSGGWVKLLRGEEKPFEWF